MVFPFNPNTQKTLIVITGPTASGKTSLAIDIAEALQTEIISADSRQFFKELKIGTASPTEKQLNRVKHHFVANLSITESYNAYRFEKEVMQLLTKLFKDLDYVILTGGSGLYIDAVCKGIDILPDPDIELRNEVKQLYKSKGISALQAKLRSLDPDYFEIVDQHNPKRLMRAIEVTIAAGKPYSQLRQNVPKKRPFKILKIGLNPEKSVLIDNINTRVDQMIEDGLIEEVKSLIKFKDCNALNTVGYKEVFAFLDGTTTLEEAIGKIKTNTRKYAKRQLTWFKKYESIKWFSEINKNEVLSYIINS